MAFPKCKYSSQHIILSPTLKYFGKSPGHLFHVLLVCLILFFFLLPWSFFPFPVLMVPSHFSPLSRVVSRRCILSKQQGPSHLSPMHPKEGRGQGRGGGVEWGSGECWSAGLLLSSFCRPKHVAH